MTYIPAYQGGPPQESKANSGLAIGAVIVGALAFLLAWIPCINLLALCLALVGLILGVIAWVQASKVPGQRPTLAIVGVVLSVLAVPAFFISYFVFSAALERAGGNLVQFGLRTGATQEADALAADARARGVDEEIITAARAELDATLDSITTDLEDAERAGKDVERALDEYREALGAAGDEAEDMPEEQPDAGADGSGSDEPAADGP